MKLFCSNFFVSISCSKFCAVSKFFEGHDLKFPDLQQLIKNIQKQKSCIQMKMMTCVLRTHFWISLRVYPENSFRISLGIPELVYKKGFFSPVGGWGAQDHPETFGIDAYAYWAKETCCCDPPNSSWRRRRVRSKRESRKYSSKYPPFQLRSRGSVQVGQVEKSGKITKMLKNNKI